MSVTTEFPRTPKSWPVSALRSPDAAFLSSVADLKSRLLDGLSAAELARVVGVAVPGRFPAESVVVNQGDSAQQLFLVKTGCARHFFITPGGRKLLLLWLPPGSIFGGTSLLSCPSHYLVGTETVKDSSVLVWQRSAIRDLAASYPRLMENAMSIASDYLTWYVAAHVALTCHNARRRLADVLVSLAHSIGRGSPQGFELEITNEQLACVANVTLFTASRLLSDWRRKGLILKKRGKILLRPPQGFPL